MAPAVDPTAMKVRIEVAFETVDDVDDLCIPLRLQRQTGVDRALSGTADQHHRAIGPPAFATHRRDERVGMGLHLGILVPRDVHDARWVADVEVLDLHAHIDEQRVGMMLEISPGVGRQEVLHRSRAALSTMPAMRASTDYTRGAALVPILQQRIAVIDGAMGTMIQQHALDEADFRGSRFAGHPHDLKGNNEILVLTRPELVAAIHTRYLEVGADIIETNTFGATRIAQADYGLGALAREMNVAAARLARSAADGCARPGAPRFVAGALGPTPRTASISPDVADPGARNVSFDELREAYREQAEGLLEGGCDLFLVETIFDTLNAKAAIYALDELMHDTGERLPVIVSGTVTDASGRILSGQTIGAFWNSVRHARPLAIGLNCALGAAMMRPYLEELARVAVDTNVSCYPNAGLPNPMTDTGFDEAPHVTGELLEEFARMGLVNIVGGCCGTTPEHIGEIARRVSAYQPRPVGSRIFSTLSAAEG